VAKENSKPPVDALHKMEEEVKTKTIIDTVAKVKADELVDTLTDWPIEVELEKVSEHWPM